MSQFHYPKKVRYEYDRQPGVTLSYVHGVWGGITPQGEIEMNFYHESDKLPPYSERTIEPDGSLGPEEAPFSEDTRVVCRTISTQMVMSYHTAKAFLEWLQEKVDSLEMDENMADYPMGPENGFEQ